MSTRPFFLALTALGVAFAAAAATASAPSAPLAGQKLDSGLGELPHYSQWLDKSGHRPMAYRVAGESLDNGLGDLPHYANWVDKTGRDPMGRQGLQVATSN